MLIYIAKFCVMLENNTFPRRHWGMEGSESKQGVEGGYVS